MNLYNLHNKPDELSQYNQRLSVPTIAFEEIEKEGNTGRRDLEDAFIQDSTKAIHYAKNILHGRWKRAEQYIMKDADSAYLYAVYVMGERWEEAEEYIEDDRQWWQRYREHFKF